MASIPFSASTGDTTLITCPSGQTIVVQQVVMQAGATSNVTFRDGTTAVTGAMQFGLGGSLCVGDGTGTVWVLSQDSDFTAHLTGLTSSIAGWLTYSTF